MASRRGSVIDSDGSPSALHDLDALEALRRRGVHLIGGLARRAVHVVVQPRLRFTLNAAPSTTQDIDIDRAVDCADWVSGVLIVRLLGKPSWPTGASVSVLLRRTSTAIDAPSTLFLGGNIAVTTVLSTATAPRLFVAAFEPPIASAVHVSIRVSQPAATGAVGAELGIELIGRTAVRGPDGPERTTRSAEPARTRGGLAPIPYREPWGARPIPSDPAYLRPNLEVPLTARTGQSCPRRARANTGPALDAEDPTDEPYAREETPHVRVDTLR